MAKELPYFKFEPAEYLTKDVSFCSLPAQGMFINACAYYWQRLGKLTKTQLLKRINNEELLNELHNEGVIDIENDNIKIKFLDIQLTEIVKSSKKNSENGKKGGHPKLETELTALDGKVIPRTPNKGDHFLYLFKRKSIKDTYKIGETKDLFKRRNTIKVPSKDLSIIHFVKINGIESLSIEKNLKNKFIRNNINGDWFEFKTQEISKVIEEMDEAKKARKKPKKSQKEAIRREEIRRDKKRKEDYDDETLYNIDDLFLTYSTDEGLKQAVIKNKANKFNSEDHLINSLEKFNSHLTESGIGSKTWKDYASHFRHWHKKQPNETLSGIKAGDIHEGKEIAFVKDNGVIVYKGNTKTTKNVKK